MHQIFEFKEINSTNTYLKDNYKNLSDGDVVVAEHQLSGRGRQGRVWKDDSNSLLFSILLKDHINPSSISLIPLLTGVAIYLSLSELGISSSIKWPNDVLIKGKKCTGILLEAVSEETIEAVIVGVGINLNDESFDSSIQNKAVSLAQELKRKLNKKEVLNIILKNFDSLYSDYVKGVNSFIPILKDHSFLDGKEVYLNYYGEQKHAKVLSISDDGRLKVLIKNKITYLSAGEVTLQSAYTQD